MMLFAVSGEPENETKAADTASSVEPELTEEERQLQEDYRRFGIEGEDEVSMDSIADVLSTYFSLVLTEPMLHHIQNFLLTVKQKLPPAVSVDGRGQFTIFIFCFSY